MEIMGLQLPGSSFVSPNGALRDALTRAAAHQLAEITALEPGYMPIARIVDEKVMVNAMVGLLATGGSTNHSIHLVAIARMAGIIIDWQDLAELSDVVPLLTRMYPNGSADVNAFEVAGGMPFLIRELLDAGLLHENVNTVLGEGLRQWCKRPGFSGRAYLGGCRQRICRLIGACSCARAFFARRWYEAGQRQPRSGDDESICGA